MWPWEHLAFAYLLYSPPRRVLRHAPPEARAVGALLLASQLPDLVDKPLAWVFGVLPAGRSLAHSLLFALPLVLVVAVLANSTRSRAVGPAFGVGYLSHLAGDVVYPLVTEGDLVVGFLLWPVVAVDAGPVEAVPHLLGLVGSFLAFLATPRGALYLVLDLTMLVVAAVAWALDGAPGLGGWRRDDV